jgi:hypothetical protein
MVAMNLARGGDTIGVQIQPCVDASVILGNGSLAVADAMTHIQGSKSADADPPQPGEHSVDQTLGGQALEVIGYDTAVILA